MNRWLSQRLLAVVVSVMLVTTASAVPARKSTERSTLGRAVLETELVRMAQAAEGEVGIFARHLETGLTVSVNDNEAFPMASTFKVAVAGTVLAKVDRSQLTLDQLIAVDSKHVLSSEGIAEIFPFTGVSASVHNLIESMLTRSDNTATNVLTELAGGPAAVTAWVNALGVQGMRIDGDTNEIVGRFYGMPPEYLDAQLQRAVAANPAVGELEYKPNPSFDDDPRDTATPGSMALLLSKIVAGDALSPASTEVMLGSMERCITGLKRLRGELPAGAHVQDKTGTIGGTTNDVGIITLPGGHGHVVIAVYIKKSRAPLEKREHVIAEIARSVYDYMLFESTGR